MNSARILVVDDDPQIRRVLRTTLVAQGYEVDDARNGEEALERMRSQKPDLIILDVNMPGMSGIEVCKVLKEQAAKEGRTVAVWLMTGAPTSEGEKAALEAGALILLAKPFNVPDLLHRIETEIGMPPPRGTEDGQSELY